MCQRPGGMGWCYSQSLNASWWPPGRGMGGMLLLVCQAPAQVWPPRWCWLWRLWAACRHSSGQLTCSKLIRGGLFHGGHVDPCPAPVCAVQCARVGLLVNIEHRLRWWLPTKEQGKGQEEKQEVAKAEGEADRGRQRGSPRGAGRSRWRPTADQARSCRCGCRLQARPGRPLVAFFVPHNSSFGRLPF